MQAFQLPENFLLGCATAATQIEGGELESNWCDWARQGRIKDKSTPARANQHWERYEQDCALMAKMGMQISRMGLEWARLEPREGEFNREAMARYRKEVELLRSSGIRPLITLHHFSNPLWFEERGGFEHRDSIAAFERFVTFAVENLGDLCGEWITINEPNVYMTNGYVFGEWPPGKKSFLKGMTVLSNLTRCHICAYKLIHRIRLEKGWEEPTMVGFANHLRVFAPMRPKNLLDRAMAPLMEYLFQGALTASMSTGRLKLPIGIGSPEGTGRFYDFIGINYYTRTAVKGFANDFMPATPHNDLNWEIYPQGLTELVKKMVKKYPAPVWITENGTCDRRDSFRPRFIYDHLEQIAVHHLPVERYYHWTFLDNFEWMEGESAPFGLVALNFETQERVLRPSGEMFSAIIKNHGFTQEMIQTYLDKGKKG